MKVLFININMHVKNMNALLNYKNINISNIYTTDLNSVDLNNFDVVYSPSLPVDVKNTPCTKFIFGPHFSVFPVENQIELIKSNNSIYILPSNWTVNLWEQIPLCKELQIQALPFGVDTDIFHPVKNICNRDKIFIYYKRRHPQELFLLKNILEKLNINFIIFDYISRYSENDYLNYLKEAKFGIWLTAHESQGFALQEALSCDVPLLVWNVTSLNQEYRSNYPDLQATTIPYWDERCGEYFYNINEFLKTYNTFINNINNYKPREFVLENLSINICENKLIQLINNM